MKKPIYKTIEKNTKLLKKIYTESYIKVFIKKPQATEKDNDENLGIIRGALPFF